MSASEKGGAGGKSDVARVADMISGYQQTCILVAALQLGLFERLAKRSMSDAELAQEIGAHDPSLRRLIVALKALGLVEEKEAKLTLTGAGKLLLKDGFGAGMRAWTLLVGEEYLKAWGNLQHSVKTGGIAFDDAFGMTAWEHRAKNPELNDCFNRVTSGEQVRAVKALLAAYPFGNARTVVDVGGGHGHLLAGVLAQHPGLSGVLFDQPHVVEGAPAHLEASGLKDRVRVVGGSFLETVPSGGEGAVYVLKHVLHNWDDDDSIRILRSCREAMGPTGTLLVLENVLPEDPASSLPLVMLDLHMMAVLGGRERTEREYAELLSAAGLRLERNIHTRFGAPDVVEAKVAT